MKSNLLSFNDRLSIVEQLLRQDDENPDEMPNLLPTHYELTSLRNIRDEAMDQITRASDGSLQRTLEDYFSRLDDIVDLFDEHVGTVCLNLINNIYEGNKGPGCACRYNHRGRGEERPRKFKALQDAQKDYKELAARFKSINSGQKAVRGYKEKFTACIKANAEGQFAQVEQEFLEDSERLEKSLKWYFNELQYCQAWYGQLDAEEVEDIQNVWGTYTTGSCTIFS